MRALAALALLLLAACGDGAALDRLAPAGKGRVVEVIAPDLVMLDDGEAVKLAGLASYPARDPYAAQARAELERLALGREVELLSGGAARDPFGRRVAHLRLVKGRDWVQGEMLEREATARAGARGLWATRQVRLSSEVRLAHGFHIVEGRVTAVRRFGRGHELDVQGLSADIPGRAAADFEAAGKAPATLAGRLVRIRGTVRQGPSMRLDHPEALEVLVAP